MLRCGCVVFLEISAIDGVLQTVTPCPYRPDVELAFTNRDRATRVFKKSPEPASLLETPRAHEDPILDDDAPETNETVRPHPCSKADDLALLDLGHG